MSDRPTPPPPADAEDVVARAEHGAEKGIQEASERAKEQIDRTRTQVEDKVKATEAKVREQVEQVQRTVGDLKGLSDPAPAESADEAVEQAADLRRAIDRDLDTLQARMPPGEELADRARTVGGVVLAVAATGAAAFLANKQRSERKRVEREAKAHADAIARYLPQAAPQPRAEAKGDGKSGGKGKLVLLAAVAAAVAAVLARRSSGGSDAPDIWGPPR